MNRFVLLFILVVDYLILVNSQIILPKNFIHPNEHIGNSPLVGMRPHERYFPVEVDNTTVELPDWWSCLGSSAPCPGYTRCGPKNTTEKAIGRDLVTAVSKTDALWVYLLLAKVESLLVTPTNYTVNGAFDVTLFFTAYNKNGTSTGRYRLPPGWWISRTIQRGNTLHILINATAPDPFQLGQNTTTPHLWTLFFNDYHEITSMRINVDPFWYPTLQTPPPTTDYSIHNFDLPPFRDYDFCIGVSGPCFDYDEPCPDSDIATDIIYQEMIFMLMNMTVNPNNDANVVYYQFYTMCASYFQGISPYLASIIFGNMAYAQYYAYTLNPKFDPYYALYALFPGWLMTTEGNQFVFEGELMSEWAPSGNRFPLYLPWWGEFNDENQLYFEESYPNAAVIFQNLQPTLRNINVTVFCEHVRTNCVSGYNSDGTYYNDVQFPVTSGPFAGIVNTCEQMFNYTITQMPVFCGSSPYATTYGYCEECRQVHLVFVLQGGPGSIQAHIHCPHVGLPKYDSDGNLYPCWNQ